MIYGWFGLPRAGKTYLAVVNALKYQRHGYKIFSNIPIQGAYRISFDDIKHGFVLPSKSILFLDEVQLWANSRDWASLDVHLYTYFSQGGKMGVDLFYTCQDSSRVDKTLREVTNYFFWVSHLVPPPALSPVYKLGVFQRVLTVDVYTNNVDFSFNRNKIRREFHLLNKRYFKYYDSFYVVHDFVPTSYELPRWYNESN